MRLLLLSVLFLTFNSNAELLEPISTDRPDATESVSAVEAGHYQMELNLAEYSRDNGSNSFGLMGVNSKFGIGFDTDIQLVFNAWNKTESNSASEFTDWGLRIKHELITSENFDLTVLPYYTFSGSTDNPYAGISLPWQTAITEEIYLKGMSQLGEAFIEEERVFRFLQTIEVTKNITRDLSGFTELLYILPDRDNNEEIYINYGLAFLIDNYTQLDFALAHGLNSNSADFRLITGLSFKR